MNSGVHITPTQAINTIWSITGNLTRLFAWLVFWIVHLLIALTCFALLWWFQVTPDQLAQAVLGWSQSKTASLLGFAGLSVLGVLAAYFAVARWLWKKLYLPWQTEQLFAGVQSDR